MKIHGGKDERVSPVKGLSLTSGVHLLGSCLVLFALLTATEAFSQTPTIAAYKYPYGVQTTLSSGGPNCTSASCTAYIDPEDAFNDPMPQLDFYVSNYNSFPSCDHIDWSITLTYTDPDNKTTYLSQSWTTSPCSYNLAIFSGDWGDDAGGNVTVTATLLDCSGTQVGNSGSFQFNIWGKIQDQIEADDEKSSLGMPWFTGGMISVESCYDDDQFSKSDGTCGWTQNVTGHPLFGGPVGQADGVGLMQPDRTRNPVDFSNGTYWNFADNMWTAKQVLNTIKTGAYSFWDSQVKDMCTYLHSKGYSATYSSGSAAGDGSCTAVQLPGTGAKNNQPTSPVTLNPSGSNDYYIPQSLPYCSANLTLSDGQPSGWKDAEWIKAYNGAVLYYIFWHTEDPDQSQYWVFNNCSGTTCNNYVYKVCNTSDY